MGWLYSVVAVWALLGGDNDAARFWFLLAVLCWRADDIITAIRKGPAQ